MTQNIFSVSVLNGTICSVFEVFDTSSAYTKAFPFCKDEDVSIPDFTPRGHVLPCLPDLPHAWRLPGCRLASPLYVRIRSYYSDEAILNRTVLQTVIRSCGRLPFPCQEDTKSCRPSSYHKMSSKHRGEHDEVYTQVSCD
jgi:hypothetical protein